jgi:hypothetical protein
LSAKGRYKNSKRDRADEVKLMIGSVTRIYTATVSFVVGWREELPKREISNSSRMKKLIPVRNISDRRAQETTVTETRKDCSVA